jgi:putative ABC transport system substrate-binding protein
MMRLWFFLLLFLAAWISPASAIAQRVYQVGALISDDLFFPAVEGFQKKMAELGYTEGKNINYTLHNAKGNAETLKKLAAKLVQAKPDLIVTSSTTATAPVAKMTSGTDLPVVFLSAGNPLEFVKSYASSGNNLTGISSATLELTAKRLELLKELAPWVKRVASLNNSLGVNYQDNLVAVREAAEKLGFTIIEFNVTSREDLARVTAAVTRKVADAIFLPPDTTITRNIDVVVRHSLKEKLPVIPPSPPSNVERGGLATYAPDYFALGQQGAVLVQKILKRIKPADLPIEQPFKLKLVINLKTAKAIALKIPKEILLRADEVIE